MDGNIHGRPYGRAMSRFRNLSISDPLSEDGVRMATLYSPALERRADLTIYVPEAAAREPLPLMILLHGVYGSHWNWWARGKAPETARQMIAAGQMRPFAIAMPSDGMWGDGSGYLPHPGLDAEAWIVEDVPACVAECFPGVRAERFYLAGLSMGGYGALRLGMKYPERVKGISAHSAITSLDDLEPFVREPIGQYSLSGRKNAEIAWWVQKNRSRLPPIRFDCGRADSLIQANRALHVALQDMSVAHSYEEFDGGHTWEYWQTHVRRTFRFFSEIEGSARAVSSRE
jgi:putative tributyrin esterase